MSEFDNVLNKETATGSDSSVKMQFGNRVEIGGRTRGLGEQIAEKRAKCFAMIDDTCLKVMASPENLCEYLMVQSKFEKYSLNNNILVFAQNSGATKLKDYNSWKKLGGSVKKGAKSILILEPVSYYTSNGIPKRGYNAKNVFDIQDVSLPSEEHPRKTTYEQKKLVEALIHDSPVPIRKTEKNLGGNFAVYDAQDNSIYFKPGLAFDDIFPAIAKALAHAEIAKGDVNYCVSDHEFKARCSAYVIAQKYGVDIHTVDIRSIPPHYASLNSEELKKELGEIHSCVKIITARMTEVLEQAQEKTQGRVQTQAQARWNRNREER